ALAAEAVELLRRRVANVHKGQVREVHAEERQTGGHVVVQSAAEDLVVLRGLYYGLECPQHVAPLVRDGVPGLPEAADGAAVQAADDGHQAVVVAELVALVCDLDPLLD